VITYGRTCEDVVRWPDDPAARHALEAYLGSLPSDSQDVLSELDARGLDFTGGDLQRRFAEHGAPLVEVRQ
jgi:hypothetical protein